MGFDAGDMTSAAAQGFRDALRRQSRIELDIEGLGRRELQVRDGRHVGHAVTIQDIVAKSGVAITIPEGYTAWAGGECPEEARDAETTVKLRDGGRTKKTRGGDFSWQHYGGAGDIIAYRVESEQAQPIPVESLGRDADPLRSVVEMIATRARNFPDFPMGYHMDELFRAIGQEPPTCDADDGVEALAAKVGVYYHDGKINLGAPLYAFTPMELAELARRLRPQVDALYIPRSENLDPIHVYFEDLAPGSGRITIACFGDAWTGAWGAMGSSTVREFVQSVDADYLTSSLLELRSTSKYMREYTKRVAATVIAALTAALNPEAENG